MSGELSYGARARGALGAGDFRFSHKLGQNFLLDDGIVDEIAEHAGVQKGDTVLEIGPGAGTLTAALIRRGAKVLAVEIDKNLENVLGGLLGGQDGVELLFADIMKCDLTDIKRRMTALGGNGKMRVVANLPYYITSDVLTKFAKSPERFESLTVMVQQEAAERIMAPVGSKQYCLLSALLQWNAEIDQVMTLSRELFTPRPHVDSALINLTMRLNPPAQVSDAEVLYKTMAAAFLMRRKTMLNNLCAAFSISRETAARVLENAALSPSVRGETLLPTQLAALSNALSAELD